MIANRLGKALVLVHVSASLLLMTFAGAIYFQQVDFGWNEPRKDMTGTVRFASEIDQRHAAVVEAQKTAELVLPPLLEAQVKLVEAEPRLYQNHIWYREQLARLDADPKPIKIRELKYDKGAVVLDKGYDIGKPELGKEIPGLDKSFEQYVKELKVMNKTIEETLSETQKEIDEQQKLTFQLTGKDNAGARKQSGLYDLVEEAYQDQVRTKFEIEYLEPQWVEVMRLIDQFEERNGLLKDNLERLKKARLGKK